MVSITSPNRAGHLRRDEMPPRMTAANNPPKPVVPIAAIWNFDLPEGKPGAARRSAAAVKLYVDVLVFPVPAVKVTLAGFNEQEICTVELEAQVKSTVPVKPFSSVTVKVEVPAL